uniref:Uncharacterized protein n=1 Tax=Rhizophora mucronata TaxID=61149 RepID=A0A2P2IQS7_RHIMU
MKSQANKRIGKRNESLSLLGGESERLKGQPHYPRIGGLSSKVWGAKAERETRLNVEPGESFSQDFALSLFCDGFLPVEVSSRVT